MRILQISHLYPSQTLPAQGRFIHQHVKALAGCGLAVRVVSPVPWPPPLLRKCSRWSRYHATLQEGGSYEGVPVQRVPYLVAPRPWHVWGGLGMAWSLRGALRRIHRTFPFDLIHAHTLTPDGWAACLTAPRFGVPVVCSIRGSDLNLYPQESRVVRRATRFVLRHCHAIVAVSGALAKRAREFCPGGAEPRVIYNGVNTGHFARQPDRDALRATLGLPRDGRIVLFVGQCAADKGVPELVKAFSQLRAEHSGLHLVLVGNGELFEQVRAQGRILCGNDGLTVPGQVPPERVAAYCRASDLFAFPSHAEGMPNALLEAMACGLPCVATRVGGIPEAIEDGVSGLLVPAKDPQALHRALGALLSDPGACARIGGAAAQKIASCFSWKHNAEMHLALYRHLLNRSCQS
jgi:glycosyltransferase involved in cell wall biosynthesis